MQRTPRTFVLLLAGSGALGLFACVNLTPIPDLPSACDNDADLGACAGDDAGEDASEDGAMDANWDATDGAGGGG